MFDCTIEVISKDFKGRIKKKFFCHLLVEVSNFILIGFIFAYFNY